MPYPFSPKGILDKKQKQRNTINKNDLKLFWHLFQEEVLKLLFLVFGYFKSNFLIKSFIRLLRRSFADRRYKGERLSKLIARFNKIDFINLEVRDTIYAFYLKAEKRLIDFDSKLRNVTSLILTLITTIGICTGMFGCSSLTSYLYHSKMISSNPLSETSPLSASFFYFLFAIFACVYLIIWIGSIKLFSIFSREVNFVFVLMIAIIIAIEITILVLLYIHTKDIHLQITLLAALIACIVINFVYLVVIIALITSLYVIYSLKVRKLTIEFIVDNLLGVLYFQRECRLHNFDVYYKRLQLSRLEIVAECLENYLFKHLKSGDQATDIWTKERLEKVAASIRAKKKWVINPKKDTHNYLTLHLLTFIVAIIENDWDSLEQNEPLHISSNKRWFRNMLIFFKTVVIAIIPFLCLFLSKLTPLELNQQTYQYMIVGSLIWAILTLLIALDQNFSIKIAAIKDVINLLPGNPKKD